MLSYGTCCLTGTCIFRNYWVKFPFVSSQCFLNYSFERGVMLSQSLLVYWLIGIIIQNTWMKGIDTDMRLVLKQLRHAISHVWFVRLIALNHWLRQVNPEIIGKLEEAGLKFVGRDETGKRMEVCAFCLLVIMHSWLILKCKRNQTMQVPLVVKHMSPEK